MKLLFVLFGLALFTGVFAEQSKLESAMDSLRDSLQVRYITISFSDGTRKVIDVTEQSRITDPTTSSTTIAVIKTNKASNLNDVIFSNKPLP